MEKLPPCVEALQSCLKCYRRKNGETGSYYARLNMSKSAKLTGKRYEIGLGCRRLEDAMIFLGLQIANLYRQGVVFHSRCVNAPALYSLFSYVWKATEDETLEESGRSDAEFYSPMPGLFFCKWVESHRLPPSHRARKKHARKSTPAVARFCAGSGKV